MVVFEIKSGYNHAKEIENIITVKENKCTLFCIEIEIWKRSMIQNHEVAKKITTSKIIKTKLGNSYNQGFNF